MNKTHSQGFLRKRNTSSTAQINTHEFQMKWTHSRSSMPKMPRACSPLRPKRWICTICATCSRKCAPWVTTRMKKKASQPYRRWIDTVLRRKSGNQASTTRMATYQIAQPSQKVVTKPTEIPAVNKMSGSGTE